jgi:predicted alpha/beta hydrolase family esterase
MTMHLSAAEREPLILTVPGLDGSGPSHWQTLWEQELPGCARVDLGSWHKPNRNSWVNRLNLAIREAGRPVVLVAHSLGCLAVAWWAKLEQPAFGDPVVGALLVAPPEVDVAPLDARLADFAPTPILPLPFPSIVVASQDDPHIHQQRARRLSFFWGSQFADAGQVGHINAESELGQWDFGRSLLGRLTGQPWRDRGEALFHPFFIEGEARSQSGANYVD